MNIPIVCTLLCVLSIACQRQEKRRLIIDDEIVEGNISEEGIYNGLIRSYNKRTNRLVRSAYYENDTLNGKRIEYYQNGKVSSTSNYERGKIVGDVVFFDTSGRLEEIQFRYYDLRVGPSIHYQNGQVKDYYFYSLDNQELAHVSYDSLQFHTFEKINDSHYFFWHTVDYFDCASREKTEELFFYVLDPPKLNFKYSLCVIQDGLKIVRVIKEFGSNEHWIMMDLDQKILEPGQSFALRLNARNELRNDGEATMLKRL